MCQQLSRGQLSWGQFSWVAIVPRGSWPGGQLTGWQLPQMAIALGGSCPGGSCPGAVVRGGNCPGGNWPDTGIYYISCMNYDIYFLIQLFRPLYLRFNQNVSFHTCISPTIPARPCRDSRWTLAVFPLVQVWYTVNSSLFSFPVFC